MASLLLIEDDKPLQDVLKRMLEQGGHRVRTADDGSQCVELLERETTDLLITDIFMPESDGIETIRRVRQRFADLKIIAISGGGAWTTSTDYLWAAKMLGADCTLRKPFRRTELLGAVERCLRGGDGPADGGADGAGSSGVPDRTT